MNEKELFNRIFELKEELIKLRIEHWKNYSSWDTWYFWFNIISIIVPLVILFFKIDKQRLFEICFYGYTVHVLWSNIDNVLSAYNYLLHPHGFTHFFPLGITVTAVLLPVTFMLLYQHCTNKEKNFYIYAVIISIIFAYGFGFISKEVGLLTMHKGMNLTYLFLMDIAVAYIAFWLTKLFIKVKSISMHK